MKLEVNCYFPLLVVIRKSVQIFPSRFFDSVCSDGAFLTGNQKFCTFSSSICEYFPRIAEGTPERCSLHLLWKDVYSHDIYKKVSVRVQVLFLKYFLRNATQQH